MTSIDAHITSVTQDPNGWFRVSTDDERIKRLDTKQQKLAQEAQALMMKSALARIEYSERDSKNINPHTNAPYIDRYYEGAVELGEQPGAQQQLPGIPMAAPTRASMPREDVWRICLTAGGKLAVATLPMLAVADRTFERQKIVAAAWGEFFFFTGPPDSPSFNGSAQFQAPAASAAPRGAGAYDEPLGRAAVPSASPPPHTDEDNPFPPGY